MRYLLRIFIGLGLFAAAVSATCGNGIIEPPGENCDLGTNNADSRCVNCIQVCLGTCSNLPLLPGCRNSTECTRNLTCTPYISTQVCVVNNYTCNSLAGSVHCPSGVSCQPTSAPGTLGNRCLGANCAGSGACNATVGTCVNYTCADGFCGDGVRNGAEQCDDGSRQPAPVDACHNCLCSTAAATQSNPTWCSIGSQLRLSVNFTMSNAWSSVNEGTCTLGNTVIGTITCVSNTSCSCVFPTSGNYTGTSITFRAVLRNLVPPCNQTAGSFVSYTVPNTNTIPACPLICGNGLLEPGEQCDDGDVPPLQADGCVNCVRSCQGTCSNFPFAPACNANSSCVFTQNCVFNSGPPAQSICTYNGYTCNSFSAPCPTNYICTSGTCRRTIGGGANQAACNAGTLCPTSTGTCNCIAVCGDNVTTGVEECDDGSVFGSDGCNGCLCSTPTGSLSNLITNSLVCAEGQPLVVQGNISYPSWAQIFNATCSTASTTGTLNCNSNTCICTVPAPAQPWDPAGIAVNFTVIVRNTICPTRTVVLRAGTLVDVSSELPCTDFCGNGVLEEGEACDDGNQVNSDGCSNCVRDCTFSCSNLPLRACQQNSDCTVTPTCTPAGPSRSCRVNTDCADANQCPPGWSCASVAAYCFLNTNPASCPCPNTTGICGNPVCTQTCGDAVVQGTEQCDDGTLAGDDGCAACVCEVPPNTEFTITSNDQICGGGQTITAHTTFATPFWVQLVNSSCSMGNSIGTLNCMATSCTCIIETPPGPYNPSGVPITFTFGVRNNYCMNNFVNITGQGLVNLSQTVCLNFCGNGILENDELCDDGNEVSDDGCTDCLPDCRGFCEGFSARECISEADCDGVTPDCETQQSGRVLCRLFGQTCTNSSECPSGYNCNADVCRVLMVPGLNCEDCPPVVGGACNTSQCPPLCNNGILENSEECDDGSLSLPDGCINCTCVNIPYTELTVNTEMQICGEGDVIVVDVGFSYPSWVNVYNAVCYLDNEHFGVLSCSAPGVCTCTFTVPENMHDLFPCDSGVPVIVEIGLVNSACPSFMLNLSNNISVNILHCSDNIFCNGEEQCSTTEGCLPSTGAPACNDNNDCTLDYCFESECRMNCFETQPENPEMCLSGCASSESESYAYCLAQLQACTGNALTCNSAFQACYTGSGCRMAITDTENCPCTCNFIKQEDQQWPEPN